MDDLDKKPEELMLLALLRPFAKVIIENEIGLSGTAELLKSALVAEAYSLVPHASVSQVSLMTGVHRKDIKRIEAGNHLPGKGTAAARVVTLWQNDPSFVQEGKPRTLTRSGVDGFDALVALAKVDAAPATLLSLLIASGNVVQEDGLIRLVAASLVPDDHIEKMRAAVATLVPHLETTADNLAGKKERFDQVLRYSHLTEQAADQLEAEATRMAMEMLLQLNQMANSLQQEEEGDTLFVAGAFVNKKVHD